MKQVLFFTIILLSIGSCKKQDDRPKTLEIDVSMSIGLDNELSLEIFDYQLGQVIFSETLVGTNRKTDEGHPIGDQQIFSLTLNPSSRRLRLTYRLKRNTEAQGWGGWIELRKGNRVYFSKQVGVTSSQTHEIDVSKPEYG